MEGAVLHLLRPAAGGIRRHVGALASALAGAGWRVEVAAPGDFLPQLEAALDPAVGRHAVEVPARPSPGALAAARRQLAALLAGGGYDLLHLHGTAALLVAVPLLRRLPAGSRPAVAVTLHNLPGERGAWSGLGYRHLERSLLPLGALWFAASPLVRQQALRWWGLPAERVRVLPAPLEPPRGPAAERPSAWQSGTLFVVGTAARLVKGKGLETLLQAASHLRMRLPELRLWMVGDGPLREPLRRQAEAAGLAGRLRWEGAVADAGPFLGAMDCVVVPSRVEALSLTALEALARARPLVVSEAVARTGVVEPGVTGWSFPTGDAAALAARLEEVWRAPDEAAQRAARGRQRTLARHGLRQALEEVLAGYETLRAGGRRSGG
ncbi:MAG: glycosyltransferase family 4 protein [Bacillota bacterium]|nr:glycosyltransferase family 4 protein [Bacillota bacterium]